MTPLEAVARAMQDAHEKFHEEIPGVPYKLWIARAAIEALLAMPLSPEMIEPYVGDLEDTEWVERYREVAKRQFRLALRALLDGEPT